MELTDLFCEMSVCRLCAQENPNGSDLFPTAENETDLSQLINKYLPLKIENDNKYPKKICPGCNIQLDATVSFMNLIIEGQEKLRQLFKLQKREERQRLQLEQALKNVNPTSTVDAYTIQTDESGEKFLIQIFSPGPLFPPEHELCLLSEGLTKPKRKRGRPPKLSQSQTIPEEDTIEETNRTDEDIVQENTRKRRIRIPTRYSEAIRGKELDNVFKLEGVIDEEIEQEKEELIKGNDEQEKVIEVIGRLENEKGEDLGQPVIINKNLQVKSKYKIVGANQSKKKRKYQCEHCGKDFLHHGRYQLHKKTHAMVYMCTEENCKIEFESKLVLQEHQQKTGHINFILSEKLDLYGTLQFQSQVKQTLETETKSNLINKQDFLCKTCNKTFSCKQNLEVHLKAVHGGERPFVCKICNKRFSYPSALKVHSIQHSKRNKSNESGRYKCPSCPKTFRHPSSLLYHRESQHTNGRRFVCNKCDKPFKHRQLLQRHQAVHSDERPFRCSQCSAAFKTRANLIHHSRSVHAGHKNHWCSQCNKAFAHKTALRIHQRWHAGDRPYQCEFCKKAFSQKGNLIEHKRIHTGEKPFQCQYCPRAFTTSSQFRLHTKKHLDERPHKCQFCQKCFLHKVTLKNHMRRHLDEKPFKCRFCHKGFPEAANLKKHERVHTGEKPFMCEMCPKTFADSSNLIKHRKVHQNYKNKQILFMTYAKEGDGEAIVTYIEPQDPVTLRSNQVVQNETILKQLVDQEGNPITFITQDGQQVKVVTNDENEENIQGLLPDGTLVPISLTTELEKNKTLMTHSQDPSDKIDLMDTQILSEDVQFLSNNEQNVGNDLQFITEGNQNMCLVTTYNIEETINPQYLTMS